MKFWYVSSFGSWFVVGANRQEKARQEGVREFGRSHVKDVREATAEEVQYFRKIKGQHAIECV
jgi:hypothetical protein